MIRLSSVCLVIVMSLHASLDAGASTFDPFLEDLRVGKMKVADLPRDDAGWPRALFTPLTRSVSRDSLDGLLLEREASRDSTLTAWRLLEGMDSSVLRDVRRAHALHEDTQLRAVNSWKHARYRDSAAQADSVLQWLKKHAAPSEQRLIWTMRHRAAVEAAADTVLAATTLWPELLELGSRDRQPGWDLWRGRRTTIGAPMLPAAETSSASARFLCRLRKSGLDLEQIEASAFSRRWKNDLRLACLEGEGRRAVFDVLTTPPPTYERAVRWASALYQTHERSDEVVRTLARNHRLPDATRASYWQRLADRHLTATRFEKGRQSLAEASRLALRSDSSSLRSKVANECRRGAAMARHRGKTSIASRFDSLATRCELPTNDRRYPPRHRGSVRAGEAASFGEMEAVDLVGAAHTIESHLWPVWVRWGRNLARRAPADEQDSSAYVSGLNALADSSDADGIAALLGQELGHRGLGPRALGWALILDRERLSRGRLPAEPSPVPGWLEETTSGAQGDLERHLLLGYCMLVGDARGALSAAVSLPRGALTEEEQRLFLFPLPRRPDLLAAVAQHPDPTLILGIARNESLFDPAVRSHAGALGLMQVMPFHFDDKGVSGGEAFWRRPLISLSRGVAVLQGEIDRYDGDPYRAVAAYNAGSGAVDRWDRQLGGSPDRATFLAWIGYHSTRRYVEKVLIDRLIYAEILRNFAEEEDPEP